MIKHDQHSIRFFFWPQGRCAKGQRFSNTRSMHNIFWTLALVLLSASATIERTLAAELNKGVEGGWLLNQETHVFGKRKIYVRSDGSVKIAHNQGCVVVCAAPSWKPIAYNEQVKMFCFVKPESWSRNFAMLYSFKEDISGKKFVFKKTCSVAGHAARVYVYESKSSSPIKSVEYIESTDVKLSPEAVLVMGTMYRLPIKTGVPLRLTFFDRGGKALVVYDTVTIEPKKIANDTFMCPKDLKLTTNQMDVMTGEVMGDVLGDMTDGLGRNLGTHTGR